MKHVGMAPSGYVLCTLCGVWCAVKPNKHDFHLRIDQLALVAALATPVFGTQ
jgi:hypothetical protein